MSDYFAEPSAGVVRVEGRPDVGTGFVASAAGLIVTCAHLLADCKPGDTIDIVPHATGQPIPATVELLKDPPDVAVLRLAAPLPREVAVLQLGRSPATPSPNLRTFGYPGFRAETGFPGEVAFNGFTRDAGYTQLALHSDDATLGFSGAPIWDPELHAVIGMIKSIAVRDAAERLRNTAIGVPGEVIQQLHHDLRQPADSPYGALEPSGTCLVSSEYPPRMFGGLGAHVEQLAAALGEYMDVNIVLPNNEYVSYDEPSSPRVHLNSLWSGNPSYGIPASWLTFATNAADRIENMISGDTPIDVIHCHDWVTVLAGVRCRWKYNIPLVFHVHLPNRTPLCASIENLGLACADLVTVSSESMREELRSRSRALGLGAKPIEVVANGVDLDIFQARDDWPADDGYILFVGRLVAQKGLEYLLRAFPYVLQRFPDLQLKIVGTGDLQSRLQRLSKNLMISEQQVEFKINWTSRPELAKLYQGARAVVVPSIYEPFGMTALEALACQRPVVASRTGGLKETIRHNVNGFLAEPRDELDLAQWIMTLMSDAKLRKRMGEDGRKQLSTENTWPRIARQVRQLYIRLCASPVNRDIPPEVNGLKAQVMKLAAEIAPGSRWEWEALFNWEPRP